MRKCTNCEALEDLERLRKWHRIIINKIVWDRTDYQDREKDLGHRIDLAPRITSPEDIMIMLLQALSGIDDKFRTLRILALSVALTKFQFNQCEASKYLGMKRTTFREQCVQAGLLGKEDEPKNIR